MKRINPISIVLVVLAIGFAVYLLIPTFRYYSKTPQVRKTYAQENPKILKNILNLGLDLQGGMRLVLEVDRSEATDEAGSKDVVDVAYAIIENRINEIGVAEPTLQRQGKDRIIVELPGLKDEQQAKDIIGRTAQLEFKLLRNPAQLQQAISVIDNTLSGKAPEKDTTATDSAAVEEKEQQELAEGLFAGSEKDTTAKDTADTSGTVEKQKRDVRSIQEYLVQIGEQIGAKATDIHDLNRILARDDVVRALDRAGLGGNVFLWSHDTTKIESRDYKMLYYLNGSNEMTGGAIKDAQPSIDREGLQAGKVTVDLELTPEGARKFSKVTATNVNKYLAIVLDSTVYSAPRIIQKISLGRAQITGNFTMQEAKNLSIILKAGALPAPVNIIEERTVGPSLGKDSIDKGILAGIIGSALVVIFMLLYYRASGFIALIALALNILAVLATMAGLNATLTLPGIAGLILLVGIGVDANVIIFERIREEIKLGKTVRSAIDAGYSSAFVTIMDANITTLITASILWWQGTGAIRGFAIALILGIIASLITALFISRIFMDFFFQRKKSAISI